MSAPHRITGASQITRIVLAALAMAALCVAVAACGGSSNATKSDLQSSASAGRSTFGLSINDGDDSDDNYTSNISGEKSDDGEVDFYGHAATRSDRHAVTIFAKRFIAAAAAEDGATACTLLLPSLARSVPADYGKQSGAMSYMRGTSCAQVMSKLFKHFHRQFATEAAGLEITGVRDTGRTAFALLAFRGQRERRYMGVERFHGGWKLEALRDSEYP